MAKETVGKKVLRLIRQSDLILFGLMVATSVYGFALVYSVSYTNGTGLRGCLMQLISLCVGLAAALVISCLPYEKIAAFWPVWAGAALVLILLTFTPLGINVPGTDDTAWLAVPLGPFSVSLQPSEIAKIVFIITFSEHLASVGDRVNRPLVLLGLLAHGMLPILLVFLQGDDGTACIFLLILLGLLFSAGMHPLYFLGGAAGAAALVPLVWNHLSADKQARFLCIFFVDRYAETTGWQQRLALSAIGSGDLWGVGFLQGNGNYLYARNNDMIFTVAGEEFGFIGALLVMVLLTLLLIAIYINARHASTKLGMYICIGMICYIGFQAAINIGMCLRVLPVLGITLPFFSAGGTSLATLLAGMGLVLSVHRFSLPDQRQHRFK